VHSSTMMGSWNYLKHWQKCVDHRGKIMLSQWNSCFHYKKNSRVKLLSPMCRGGACRERHSFYSFLTMALDGGEWLALHPSHALPLGKVP
jgi:hypothetical protein